MSHKVNKINQKDSMKKTPEKKFKNISNKHLF